MMLLFTSFFFKLFSSLYIIDPPKKINKFEGYRTKKSMSSQENWDKAQQLMVESFQKVTKILVVTGLIFSVLEVISFFIKIQDFTTPLFIVETIVLFLVCGYIYYSVEKKL